VEARRDPGRRDALGCEPRTANGRSRSITPSWTSARRSPSPGTSSRFLAGGIERLDSLEWTTAPIAIGQKTLAGELADVIAAICAGVAYANVHTTLSPGGEIRGQIKASNDKD